MKASCLLLSSSNALSSFETDSLEHLQRSSSLMSISVWSQLDIMARNDETSSLAVMKNRVEMEL